MKIGAVLALGAAATLLACSGSDPVDPGDPTSTSGSGASGADGGAGTGATGAGGPGSGAAGPSTGGTGATSVGGTGPGGSGQGGSGGGPPCETPADCDDGNACTSDVCSASGCANDPIDVDDDNACTIDACDPASGVSHVPVVVDDNDACTNDACTPSGGVTHTPIDPSDMNQCTLDSCDPGVGPVNVGEVVLFSEDFSDNSAGWTLGTEWAIGPAVATTGTTQGGNDPGEDHSPSADNGVAGVVIGGNAAVTVHGFYYLESPTIPVTAPPGGFAELRLWRWLNADYDPYMTSQIEVFDGTGWVTLWATGSTTTVIDATPLGNGWFPMSFDITSVASANFRVRVGFDITSTSAYSIGSWTLDDISVVTSPVATDDDQCTTLSCDSVAGATETPLNISDNNACTTDVCTTATGVKRTTANVDDGNSCTIDACDPATGAITHTVIDCNDNNACTTDSCNSAGACVHTPVTCNDNNACTTDSCNPATGGCTNTAKVCNDSIACTTDTCNPATGCTYTPTTVGCNECSVAECGISLPPGQQCHCDSSCQSFNDCCSLVGENCGFWDGNTTCEPWECGNKGGNAPNCFCDQSCVTFGDCCTGGPC